MEGWCVRVPLCGDCPPQEPFVRQRNGSSNVRPGASSTVIPPCGMQTVSLAILISRDQFFQGRPIHVQHHPFHSESGPSEPSSASPRPSASLLVATMVIVQMARQHRDARSRRAHVGAADDRRGTPVEAKGGDCRPCRLLFAICAWPILRSTCQKANDNLAARLKSANHSPTRC